MSDGVVALHAVDVNLLRGELMQEFQATIHLNVADISSKQCRKHNTCLPGSCEWGSMLASSEVCARTRHTNATFSLALRTQQNQSALMLFLSDLAPRRQQSF